MKFVSDILAKAGLVVDGVVTLNNTATGQTPAANDNSTKLATTAWVQNYVVPYSLPTASATILGGVKVGTGLAIDGSGVLSLVSTGSSSSFFKAEQTFTATAGQTTFTFVDGYAPGYVDVFLNGVYLSKTEYVATNGTTVVLNDPSVHTDIITIISYSTYVIGETPSARTTCRITATAGQTSFPCTYAVGQIDVFYNGSKLDTSEYTALDGATVILGTPAVLDDKIEIVTWLVGGGIPSSRTITINGVTYDLSANRTWNVSGTLPTGGNTGQLLSKVDGSDYNVQWIDEAPAASYTSQLKHRVKSSQAITKGQAVYVSSADGTNMIISKASNASEGTSSKTMGLLESTVAINGTANVITEGLLAGLDTTGANAAGDPVWLGTDGNLIYGLLNKPVAPAHLVFIGVVTRRNANNGEIFVKVQNGFEFGELHDYVQNGVQDNYVISYENSTSLYKPKSIATLLGYTPANPANVLALSGGTLTGTLNGTSAAFSSTLSATSGSFNGNVRAVNLYNIYKSDNTTLGGQLAFDSSINQLYLWNNISSGYFSIYVNSSERLKIESNGNTLFSGKTFFNANNGAIEITGTGYTANTTGMLLGQFVSGMGYIQAPTSGRIEIWNSATENVATFNHDKSTRFYGNVIGTSAAFSSNVSIGDYLRLTKGTSSDIQAYTGSVYSNLNYDAASHNWQTSGGTAKMVLTSGGNFGLGTTTPTSLPSGGGGIFSIYQSGAASLWLGGSTLSIDGQGTARDLYFYFRYSSTANFQTDSYYRFFVNTNEVMRITSGGITQIKKGDGADALQIYGSGSSSYWFFKSSASIATIGSYTTGSGYLPIYVEGSNVLIGTSTDAGYKLDVSGTIRAKGTGNYNGFFADNSSSATIGGGYYIAASFGVNRGIIGVAGAIQGNTDNNIGIFAEGGSGMGAIKYYVNGSGTPSHIMDASGRLGIGTIQPGIKLDVVGGTTLSGTISAVIRGVQDRTDYKGVVLGYDTSGQTGVVYAESNGVASNLSFVTYNGSTWGERMRVSSTGAVKVEGSLKVTRSIYNWYQTGTNSWDGYAYLHIKTGLWGGSGGNNSMPTMSLFSAKLYSYSSNYIREGNIGFHNWSGSIYNTSTTGNIWAGAYVSSDGYVVLIVALGSGSYIGINVDWHQSYAYGFQDRSVSATAFSNSASSLF